MHTDDISSVLILNKKSISNQENQLFKAELEKFRPHQTRLLQANHKQASLMKELTRTYSDLLQDKRVRSEQSKYEAFSRQRNSVMTKYRRVFQAFNDLVAGLMKAQSFYSEMKETVESLGKNVETFVNNRRSEGAQLLSQIENAKNGSGGAHADRERERLKELMERMSMDPSRSPVSPAKPKSSRPPPLQQTPSYQSGYNPAASPPVTPRYPVTNAPGQYGAHQMHPPPPQPGYQQPGHNGAYQQGPPYQSNSHRETYNPNNYGPVSPPPHQQFFSQQPSQYSNFQSPPPQQQTQFVPPGYIPPPPPPGPPPQQQHDYSAMMGGQHPAGPGGYAQPPPRGHQQPTGPDPWQGLNAWK